MSRDIAGNPSYRLSTSDLQQEFLQPYRLRSPLREVLRLRYLAERIPVGPDSSAIGADEVGKRRRAAVGFTSVVAIPLEMAKRP